MTYGLKKRSFDEEVGVKVGSPKVELIPSSFKI
jgi:hypothetical protein